jgi:uncharacterized membrane protein (DUF4010 family)
MPQDTLFDIFLRFGLAGLLGFFLGLEREISSKGKTHVGSRDFTLFALLGAVSAFAAARYENPTLSIVALVGFLALLVSGYWVDRKKGPGLTTEVAALLTFFLGVLIIEEAIEIAIALAIVLAAVLYSKRRIRAFRTRIKGQEMQAVLLLLVITFIILPVLPRQSLDTFLTTHLGSVTATDSASSTLQIDLLEGRVVEVGERIEVYSDGRQALGSIEITSVGEETVGARFEDEPPSPVTVGSGINSQFAVPLIATMLSALKPYMIWLIVILVSFISFIGYVLIKLIGSGVGIGLTGLIGGLVSSTVTTLSFSRRSRENPELNEHFAVAVILASSIMFPRLILQIGVFNQALMKNIALPLLVMGGVGMVLAAFYFFRSRGNGSQHESVSFSNPFSLKAAITFGLVFSVILVFTRVATVYLGSAWLPAVAVVSGLTDADAIAFSVSDSERAGLITLDWASFNLVLGALSNTFMKLFLIFSLGHRGLFRRVLVSFMIIGVSGVVTMVLYYDLGTAMLST